MMSVRDNRSITNDETCQSLSEGQSRPTMYMNSIQVSAGIQQALPILHATLLTYGELLEALTSSSPVVHPGKGVTQTAQIGNMR